MDHKSPIIFEKLVSNDSEAKLYCKKHYKNIVFFKVLDSIHKKSCFIIHNT